MPTVVLRWGKEDSNSSRMSLEPFPAVLVRVLLLWTDTVTKASLIKKQHLIGAGLQVQRFSPLSSRWEHGSIQAGMAQEELRVLCLHPKAASGRLTSRQLGWGRILYPHPQWHTHSNQVTPIPTRPHLQMVPLPGPRIYKPSHLLNPITIALITSVNKCSDCVKDSIWQFSSAPFQLLYSFHPSMMFCGLGGSWHRNPV
jgi:hypothetical protein